MGQAFTWATGLLESRATAFLPPHVFVAADDQERWATHGGPWSKYVDDLIKVSLDEVVGLHDGEARAQRLLTAARKLVDALRAAGPDVGVWTPFGTRTSAFWASWGAMETAVDRVDAQLSLGQAPDTVHLSDDLSLDTLQFWLRGATSPDAAAFFGPRLAAMAGEGESFRFRAMGAAGAVRAEWLVLRTPKGLVMAAEDDGGRTGMTVSGRAGDLLMLLKRRVPMKEAAVDVQGDARLLEHWLENVLV
ncbi:hypothetical protein ABZ599_38590 [Streptomyces misionensis]|uniref:hypothetical protein n=1 Tax=Streptomyces misionensis TaxID=67331 RepID=UPI0033FE6FFD